MKGSFIDNLPRVYGIYTGGFIGFIIIMAIAEQMGMSAKAIGIAFVAFTVFIYALIGYLSRTAQASRCLLRSWKASTNGIQWNGHSSRLDVWCFIRCNGGWYLL